MGVCCIVFDIDGMLFEFCMNFLNIEKKKFKIFFSVYYNSIFNKSLSIANGFWIYCNPINIREPLISRVI